MSLHSRLRRVWYGAWFTCRDTVIRYIRFVQHVSAAIRHTSSWRTLWFILWPFPWTYRIPPPMSVQEILDDRPLATRRFGDCREFSYFSLFKARDTPLFAFYRLYEVAVAQSGPNMFEGSKYLWVHGGPLKDMPDPKDPDPVRYAALAGLMHALCQAFNWRADQGCVRGYHTFGQARATGLRQYRRRNPSRMMSCQIGSRVFPALSTGSS
ncbi:hypothetical protein C8R43DRAFT_1020803 [Mycena crocata]|nr:hypothetical protein C8R43DRAFT_1020803 [Mycena crocata]